MGCCPICKLLFSNGSYSNWFYRVFVQILPDISQILEKCIPKCMGYWAEQSLLQPIILSQQNTTNMLAPLLRLTVNQCWYKRPLFCSGNRVHQFDSGRPRLDIFLSFENLRFKKCFTFSNTKFCSISNGYFFLAWLFLNQQSIFFTYLKKTIWSVSKMFCLNLILNLDYIKKYTNIAICNCRLFLWIEKSLQDAIYRIVLGQVHMKGNNSCVLLSSTYLLEPFKNLKRVLY